MDLQQAKVLLFKINTLNDSLSLDDGPIASIERDLMLSYIRQLYETFLETSVQEQNNSTSKGRNKTAAPEVIRPQQEAKPESPKRKYTPPKIIEIPDTPPEPIKVAQTTPPPKKVEPVAAKPPQPKPAPPPVAVKSAPSSKSRVSNPKIAALFDLPQTTELSEKLSLSPIKDLTKGLSINDRLLYTNDLFQKDTTLFNASLKTLNTMPDMASAQVFLEEQAAKYNWMNGEKVGIAKDFIKHVRRRYV